MDAPENWVTRERRERAVGSYKEDLFPDLTKAQVEWLKRKYPPRCLDVGSETTEQHILYAGGVSLAQRLIAQWETRDTVDGDADPTLVGERAS